MAGIEQTLDVLNYAGAIIDELKLRKEDDGNISVMDMISTLASTAPEGMDAIVNSGQIMGELADLDDAEKQMLLEGATDIAIKLIGIFIPSK